MAAIKIGVIGLGGIGTYAHIPGIDRSGDLELVAICDIIPARLEEVGNAYGIPPALRFSDYRDLIRCPQVEAVDICTPNDCHYEMALAVAEEGKPYSVEKPVTMNAEEAETLATRTREAGVKNMVCFSYRFKTAARYARELISRGDLGRIYHVNAQYSQAWAMPDMDTPLVWRFVKARTGSGALGDLGCHMLDLVRFLTGREYLKVVSDADTYVKERRLPEGGGTGVSDVDDYCNYLARMEEGVSASFQITRFGFGRGNYQRVEIYGEKGALVYKLDETPNGEELELCLGKAMGELHTFTPVPLPDRCKADQMQNFADIINGTDDGLAARIEDGWKNQVVLDAVLRSAETGSWVAL